MNTASPDPEDPLLRALAQYWDEVLALTDEAQQRELQELVMGGTKDPAEAHVLLQDLLMDLLPDDHPLVPLLLGGGMFEDASRPPADLAGSWARLQARLLLSGAPVLPEAPAAQSAEMSEFDRQIQARLLNLPWLSPAELRSRRIDPDDSRLIRLTHPDRGVQVPAFQFTPEGAPWPVVREVNGQLAAATDPWGVTCWWVDSHAGLGHPPAALLGQGRDELLRRAAASVGVD